MLWDARTGSCQFPQYGSRRRSREVLLPLALPYERPNRCKSWRCESCGALKARDARLLIRLGVTHALAVGDPLIFLTLTEDSNARGYRESSRALTQFMKRLQHRYGGGLRWVAVPEWQKRGAVHWHLLIAGLAYPRAVVSRAGRRYPGHARSQYARCVSKRELASLVLHYGFGRVFDVHAVGVGADAGEATAREVARYVGKYLTKQLREGGVPRNGRPVRMSQGRNQWCPGVTLTLLAEQAAAQVRARYEPEGHWREVWLDRIREDLSHPSTDQLRRLPTWERNRRRLQAVREAKLRREGRWSQ